MKTLELPLWAIIMTAANPDLSGGFLAYDQLTAGQSDKLPRFAGSSLFEEHR